MNNDFLIVSYVGTVKRVAFSDILYFEKEGRHITINTLSGEKFTYYGDFDQLQTLVDERFLHYHRSYMVNMDYIDSVSEGWIFMLNGVGFEVSPKTYTRAKKGFLNYMQSRVPRYAAGFAEEDMTDTDYSYEETD